MKYKWRDLILLKFCDSNFSNPVLCSKPPGEIEMIQFARLAAVSSGDLENTDHSKPTNSLVINDDPSRL